MDIPSILSLKKKHDEVLKKIKVLQTELDDIKLASNQNLSHINLDPLSTQIDEYIFDFKQHHYMLDDSLFILKHAIMERDMRKFPYVRVSVEGVSISSDGDVLLLYRNILITLSTPRRMMVEFKHTLKASLNGNLVGISKQYFKELLFQRLS